MKVFRISPNADCCGGAAYVAANNVKEAIQTFCESDYGMFEYTEGNCTCNQVDNMSYSTDTPFVIFDDLYLE